MSRAERRKAITERDRCVCSIQLRPHCQPDRCLFGNAAQPGKLGDKCGCKPGCHARTSASTISTAISTMISSSISPARLLLASSYSAV